MLGTSDGTFGGRERILIVDELLPGRLKRASRWHVLRRGRHWHSVLVIAIALIAVTAVTAVTGLVDGDGRAVSVVVLGFPLYAVLAAAGVLATTVVAVGRHVDTEVVPGRLIGLAVGSHTIRYRDRDSCLEYSYSCVRAVDRIGDVVIVDLGSSFWAVPMELFDGVSLEVLRTRAGRPDLPGDVRPGRAA